MISCFIFGRKTANEQVYNDNFLFVTFLIPVFFSFPCFPSFRFPLFYSYPLVFSLSHICWLRIRSIRIKKCFQAISSLFQFVFQCDEMERYFSVTRWTISLLISMKRGAVFALTNFNVFIWAIWVDGATYMEVSFRSSLKTICIAYFRFQTKT